ncbi:polyamine aminopropyltransferase [Tuberibacillus sp. Marseille-P3662]|uniref:polyamine aminopropyltransferase n=1 Tax=Tuberibacillus sp. Marseille-P3662 TaxID=1965358 RepID=UPI000A1CBE94|nr:polyamine aminopropyltransferase [Tuberibacillus sp. Marseille-P3662]
MNQLSIKQTKQIYWASGIVSICGIIFEVLFGALGSYILGDGVKQYTLTISLFLTGMGLGAYISEKVGRKLIAYFIGIEYAVAAIGGLSSFLMFGITAYLPSGSDALFLYGVIVTIGTLTGLELPILIRKANEIGVTINKSTARVLFSDYAGGLVGGILFAFWLRPYFGLVKTAFLVGLINLAVAFWILFIFKQELRRIRLKAVIGGLIAVILVWGLFFGEEAAFMFEQKIYRDPIIYSQNTEYQKIVMTKEQGDLRLYLNGNLQFSSVDEYRYHETLVHPVMAMVQKPRDVLILGGGDGLAAREVLKYPFVKQIDLVDLDPEMTRLGQHNDLLTQLNHQSLNNDKVTVFNQDGYEYLDNHSDMYDAVFIDLPDPEDTSLSKLYSKSFYKLVKQHLKPGGAIIVQSTSPVFATKVYWTINKTVESAGFKTENLHVDIPSFGNWGFVIGRRKPVNIDQVRLRNVDMRYLNNDTLHAMDTFGKDIDANVRQNGEKVKWQPNTLQHPIIIEMYQKAWLYY